jgi:tetratricopeptide (TPR) repeat protein
VPARPSALSALAATALLALAIALAYGPTLDYQFVWDDHVQIERNPWLRAPGGLRALLTNPSWGFAGAQGAQPSNYYRPLFIGSYALVARLWGTTPRAYHALSLGLHLAVCVLVASLAWRLCGRARAGLLAALVFALHPAQAEAVAWVAAQGDLLAALAGLLALRLQLAQGWRWLPLAGFALLCACLAKETGVAVVAVLGLAEWHNVQARPTGLRARAGARALLRLLPALAAVGIYLMLRWHALGALLPVRHAGFESAFAGLGLAFALLARHALLTLVPWAMPVHLIARVEAPATITPAVLLGALVLLLLLAATLDPRRPLVVVLGAAWWGLTLAPTLLSVGLGRFNFAERYQYLPLVGAALLLAAGYEAARARWPATRGLPVAAGVLVLICGLGVRVRHAPWRDDGHFFSAAVARDPRSAPGRNGLGLVRQSLGDLAGAEREFEAALALAPDAPEAWTNLGTVREARADLRGALTAYERALASAVPSPVAGVHAARLHRRLGNVAAARRLLDELLGCGNGSYEVALERALIALDEADLEGARTLLEPAVGQFPNQPRGHYLLAQVRLRQGDLAAAEGAARAAIAAGAGPGPRRLLVLVHMRRGDSEGARAWLDEALRLDPRDAQTLALRARLDGAHPSMP